MNNFDRILCKLKENYQTDLKVLLDDPNADISQAIKITNGGISKIKQKLKQLNIKNGSLNKNINDAWLYKYLTKALQDLEGKY